MNFRAIFEMSNLEKLLSGIDNLLNEGVALSSLVSAIDEFSNIERFGKEGIKKAEGNISIYGTFKTGETGAKHITLSLSSNKIDRVIKFLTNKLSKINKVI